jgi:hypothetical protein
MAIVLHCDCGKTLQVSDDKAGKKARCPGCQSILDIPAPDSNGDENVQRAGLVARPKRRRDEDDDDEPRARKRPARDDDDDEPRSKARSRRDDDDDDDEPRAKKRARDDDDDDDRPRKKKKKKGSKVLLFALLGGGLVALLVFGVVGYGALAYFLGFWPFSSGLGAEMKYVPDACKSIHSTRVAKIRSSSVWKSIESELSADDKKHMSDEFERLGLKVEDVERRTSASAKDGSITIITANKSISASSIAGKSSGIKYKETKVGSYTMYEQEGGGSCFAVPESKIYIEGSKNLIESVLKRDKKPELPDGMKKAMDLVNFSSCDVSASDLSDHGPGADKDVLAKASEMDYSSDVTVKEITLCKNSEAADDKKKEAEVAFKKLKKAFEEKKNSDDFLPEVTFSTSGSKLIEKSSMSGSEFKKAFKKGKLGTP